jgi:hypothetical protein
MILKYFLLLLSCILLSLPAELYAQNNGSDTTKGPGTFNNHSYSPNDTAKVVWKPSTSVFLELLGKGFFSLNVDFRKKETYSISVGIEPFEGFFPDVMFYHFGGERRRYEIGGGVSTGFSNKFGLKVVLINGVIGYRYQKKKNLFFRVGFTPFYALYLDEPSRNKLFFSAGLSLGYSF